MAVKVEHYDSETGVCTLRDEEGRSFTARCEPTGRAKKENQKTDRRYDMNQETVYENPGQELDRKAHAYADKRGCSYAEAMAHVAREEPELARRYAFGESNQEHEIKKGAGEFSRRVVAYQEEWNLTKDQAERRVREHDPKMKIYSNQGGLTMNTEKIPLSAESVVAARTEEKLKG